MRETVKELVPELQTNFFILVGIFLLISGFRFYDALFLKNKLNNSYGVQPRRQFSFVRFFISTLVHRDRRHLFGNGCVSFQLKQYSHVIPSGVFGARNLWCRSSDLLWQLKDSSRWS